MRFVLFSDAHIGGKFNEEMFNKGVKFINETESDYVIFCGDLTDQGTLEEYEIATENYLPKIKKRILMVPGNHDVKNVGDLLWEEFVGPRYFVHTDPEKKVKILGLDSNEPDKDEGRMGEKGIDRIYQEFQDLDNTWTQVLVFHHQSLPIKFTGRERSAIKDAGDTVKAILDCNIDLVFNGHRHISNVYRFTDGDIVTLIVNCGTVSCKKTRYHEEYSVTVVDYPKNGKPASVDVLLLNNNKEVWQNKFKGINAPINQPNNIGNLLATIVQIGNTDFSPNNFNPENFAKATRIINNLSYCDMVIHNGDITNSSYPDEFELAQALLSQINHPLLVLPGPRDYHSLGRELFTSYFDSKNPQYETDNFKLLGFNSCILEEKGGRLGRSKMKRIENELKGNEKLGVVAFHHTIVPIPKTKHESELEDAGDVLAKFVENKLDLVLTGAKNRSGCWQINDSVFVNTGTVCSRNIVTAKGNSFNIIQIFETTQGKYYKIDECFVESGELNPIGRLHVT